MLFAGFLNLLPGKVVEAKPGSAPLHVIRILYRDYFVVSSILLPRTLRRCLFKVLSIRTISVLLSWLHIANGPPCNKLMPRQAKSTPYLSCHRDCFSAKAPRPVTGWLRQVTQTTFYCRAVRQHFCPI
jgi:hypothetical protein